MKPPVSTCVHIGTSGWHYDEWRERFYPRGLAKSKWFAHYATVFNVVEINNTFYRLPSIDTFQDWAGRAPEGFIYALKAPRDFTHRYDTDRQAILRSFTTGAKTLGDHLGPILYQFPPWLKRNLAYFNEFLEHLPVGFDHVVEFRDSSWYEPEVERALQAARVSWCVHDMYGSASPEWVTGPVAYVRLHGPGKQKYVGRYGPARLTRWASRLMEFVEAADNVYCFFNNTADGAAVADALQLRELVSAAVPSPPGRHSTVR